MYMIILYLSYMYIGEVMGKSSVVFLHPGKPLLPVLLALFMRENVGVGRHSTRVGHHYQDIVDLGIYICHSGRYVKIDRWPPQSDNTQLVGLNEETRLKLGAKSLLS